MKFTTRRGRPRKENTGKDKGTAQLQEKRKTGLTTEPLDLCLSRGLITQEQHNAGIRLRWLYTLKMGAPTISAYSPESGGKICKYEDAGWLARKQAEYQLMLDILDKTKSRKIVIDTCIFSNTPTFLYDKPEHLRIKNLASTKELELLKDGLEALAGIKKNVTRQHIRQPPS